jgi:hypothetical protein
MPIGERAGVRVSNRFHETSGKIAVCGGPDVFVYQPYGIQGETLKVRIPEDNQRVAGYVCLLGNARG